MTDSNHPAPSSSSAGSPDYEGSDPDLPERPKSIVSTVQVGASAAASVTSALAASFFGVAGTLIGAAVGSIVSTVAGALYAEYLRRASESLTRNVVIQRVPAANRAGGARRPGGPSELPGRESLRPIGDETASESVSVPFESASDLRRRPEGMAPLDRTSVLPATGVPAERGRRSAGPGPLPWWRKPLLATSAVSAAGFIIAIVAVVATEGVIGHPVSGGDSGTTISQLTSSDTDSDEDSEPAAEVTEEPTAEATEATAEPTAEATAEATAEVGETVAPTVVEEPTSQTEVPSTEGADPTAATDDVAPTDAAALVEPEATDVP